MFRTLQSQLNPATLLAVVALFMALGGVSYAAATKIGTKDIKKAAVTTAKLKNNAVTGAKVKESSLAEVPKAAQATNAGSATKAETASTAANASNAEKLGGIPAASFGSGIVGAAITAPPAAANNPSAATGAPIGVGEFQMPVPAPMKVKNLTVRASGDLSRPFVLSLRKPGGQALTCGGVVICTVPGPVSFQPGELLELAVVVPPTPGVFAGATYQVGYQNVP
jgi:hypothetical protein